MYRNSPFSYLGSNVPTSTRLKWNPTILYIFVSFGLRMDLDFFSVENGIVPAGIRHEYYYYSCHYYCHRRIFIIRLSYKAYEPIQE